MEVILSFISETCYFVYVKKMAYQLIGMLEYVLIIQYTWQYYFADQITIIMILSFSIIPQNFNHVYFE